MPPLQLPMGKGKGGESGDSPIADAAGVSIPQKEDYARGVNEQHEERQDWPKELWWEIPWELLHSHALACQPLLREVDSWGLVRVDRMWTVLRGWATTYRSSSSEGGEFDGRTARQSDQRPQR